MNNEEKILGLLEKMDARFDMVDEQLATMQTDIADLKQEIHEIHLTQENIISETLVAINDGMKNINEKFDCLDSVEDKVDDHDIRLFALEQTVQGA